MQLDTERPLISVIVPFQNACLYLSDCIGSLLNQTLPQTAYELIFIDNNSTDDGAAIVAAYPKIHLLQETKQGAYSARNRGFTHARGEIIAFTDPDCKVEKDWLECIVTAMHSDGTGIVLGCRTTHTQNNLLKLLMAYEAQKIAYITYKGFSELFVGYTSNMAVKRNIMEQVGSFPEIMRGGDTVFVHRAVRIYGSGILSYRPEVRVYHLEVETLIRFYRKTYVYGQHNQAIRDLVAYRSLRTRERLQVYRDTVKNENWAWFQGVILLVLLVPGGLCYEAGRFVDRVRRLNNRKSRHRS